MNHVDWIAMKTLWLQELQRIKRTALHMFFPFIIILCLTQIVFGTVIGTHISKVGSLDYHLFIIPGQILFGVINFSYGNTASSFFNAKYDRSIEALMISPVPSHIIIAGYIGGSILIGMSIGVLIMLISAYYFGIKIYNFCLAVSMLLIFSTFFSLSGLLSAILAKYIDSINAIRSFVLTPLIYLGGGFFTLSQLSPFWQSAVKINPIVYMVSGFRFSFFAVTDGTLSFGWLLFIPFIFIFYTIAWLMIEKGWGMRH